ncbi:MAG: Glutamine--fructose-6-phosphate aminotransferase [isomerizing] [Holosporales bacterium]
MCGIVGVISTESVSQRLVDGLKRLEYRGYDSAGIATLNDDTLDRRRAAGKLIHLEDHLKDHPLAGNIGIGHTRWATHGKADTQNAHPHANDFVAVVHNGIIENFAKLSDELQKKGYVFESETDTEVVVHLLTDYLKQGICALDAFQKTLKRLEGAFALGVLVKAEPNLLLAARCGSPLVVGLDDKNGYIGSDALALAPWTQNLCYLEEGDIALLKRDQDKFSVDVYDKNDAPVTRPFQKSKMTIDAVSKGTYNHYMLKEIHEQPKSLTETLSSLFDIACKTPHESLQQIDFSKIKSMAFVACGTSYYACMVAKYWFEKCAKIAVDVQIASEFRYGHPVLDQYDVCVVVSQSGETIDTLWALKQIKEHGIPVAAIVNVDESSIARACDYLILTQAGPEIGVASTKAFTSQLLVLACMVIKACQDKGTESESLLDALIHLPSKVRSVLLLDDLIQAQSLKLTECAHALYLGRGTNYPMALEGALKLKEISYIHAQGYPAGELKHGPIALIDHKMPVVVLAPFDEWFEKTLSNVQEVLARGAFVIVITDEQGAEQFKTHSLRNTHFITLPTKSHCLTDPILYAVVVQLLAYYTAYFKGTDVDQPRNLAKSVTVE